jgi:hypothetical protein
MRVETTPARERGRFSNVGLGTEEVPIDTGPLTLLMTVIAPILLGIGLVGVLLYTWRRRRNPSAQLRTDAATKNLYDRVEDERQRTERN